MPSGLLPQLFGQVHSYIRGVWLVFIITLFCRDFCYANSVDPDQMLHYAASDLGLCCLSIFLVSDARLKWVNAV